MQFIHSDNAPAAIGPYSQAVQVGELIFISGQLGLVPDTMELETDSIKQARQCLKNIEQILLTANSAPNKVVKASIFLQDLTDFAAINQVYAEFFGEHRPARECIQVARLPKDALVEISIIAVAN